MSTSEFPEPGQADPNQGRLVAGTTAEIAGRRARTVVLHNSRTVCWMTMGCGIIAVLLGICMVLQGGSLLFPLSAITFIAALAAAQWILGGFMMCLILPWVWKWGTKMLSVHVKFDARGVDLNLGTKKKPIEMFMAWDEVSAIQQKKLGNVWEFTILAKDGSWVRYTSYTFFRSKHVARKIAERAGLTIQKV
jgi:hypothetical protein